MHNRRQLKREVISFRVNKSAVPGEPAAFELEDSNGDWTTGTLQLIFVIDEEQFKRDDR